MTQLQSPAGLHDTAVQDFASRLRGELIRPGDASYEEARKLYNGMIDKRPALIARCVDVADVIGAVTGPPPSPAGHLPWPSCLPVWTSLMVHLLKKRLFHFDQRPHAADRSSQKKPGTARTPRSAL